MMIFINFVIIININFSIIIINLIINGTIIIIIIN